MFTTLIANFRRAWTSVKVLPSPAADAETVYRRACAREEWLRKSISNDRKNHKNRVVLKNENDSDLFQENKEKKIYELRLLMQELRRFRVAYPAVCASVDEQLKQYE